MTPPQRRLLTLLVALAGLGAALLLGAPLPFLFGPLLGCLLAALLGAPLLAFGPATPLARATLGVAVGASVTPALLARLPDMALSLLLVPVAVLLIGLAGYPFFRRLCGLDRATALFAAMPGGAQDMVLFGQEAGGDARALSLIHATRIAVIVTAAPLLLSLLHGAALGRPPGEPLAAIPPAQLVLMAGAALLGWRGGERLGLFGASMIGPLLIALPLSLGGLLDHRPPAEALQAAQLVLGTAIAAHYVGLTWTELRRTVAMSALFMLILAALAGATAEAVVLLGLAPPLDAFLAFAPGGQAETAVLALAAGADLGYVVLHHLARLLLVILGAPLALRLLR